MNNIKNNAIGILTTQIRRRRMQLGLTQAEVAARAGIRQANYSRMEAGRQPPNLETLFAVLNALNLNYQLVCTDKTEYQIVEEKGVLSAEAMVMISGSSAGTQPKYYDKGYWYKADHNGYESTSEYLMSLVLSCSNIKDYVTYEKCTINGRSGCRSKGFLSGDEAFISFQRLYDMYEGGSLTERLMKIGDTTERIDFVKKFVLEYSGVDCTDYLSKILSLDMLSLNTDRHFHNLGIVTDRVTETSRPAPVFDNADSLLSNYGRFDPDTPVEELIETVYAQPFSANHEIQAKAAGLTLKIDYDSLEGKLAKESPSRAREVLQIQLHKYRKVFSKE